MQALRIFHLNTHLLSRTMAIAEEIKEHYSLLDPFEYDRYIEGQCNKIAGTLLGLPAIDRPDVIVFNEVFHEGGRKKLRDLLVSDYGNIAAKLDASIRPVIGPFTSPVSLFSLEDSGLMLFSKYPFATLRNGLTCVFTRFRDASLVDQLCAKGAGLVKIELPDAHPITIVFTHLQASYDENGVEHSDVRRKQLEQLFELIAWDAGGAEYLQQVIVSGDLNIPGHPLTVSSEWEDVFNRVPGNFGKYFYDGWKTFMHPPVELPGIDPGYTQREPADGKLSRLDYHCATKAPVMGYRLIPHLMQTPFRELSDHWSLTAVFQRESPYCTPATAYMLPLSTPDANAMVIESGIIPLLLDFADPGACQWVFVNTNNMTLSLLQNDDLEMICYGYDDLTLPLGRIDSLSTRDLSPTQQNVLLQYGLVNASADTFACKIPFFIRIRALNTAFIGRTKAGVLLHRGETPATAITLFTNTVQDPNLPEDQWLGTKDECWFKAVLPPKIDAVPYLNEFVIYNEQQRPFDLNLYINPYYPPVVLPLSTSAPEGTMSWSSHVFQIVHVMLKRAAIADVKFKIQWKNPLQYWRLNQPISLYINDETGLDGSGSDTLAVKIRADDTVIFSDSWDDADSGKDWPDFSHRIIHHVLNTTGISEYAAFKDSIIIEAGKTDRVAAGSPSVSVISRLTDAENIVKKDVSIPIEGTLSDGMITFNLTLAKAAR